MNQQHQHCAVHQPSEVRASKDLVQTAFSPDVGDMASFMVK
jgi:hypothetical protein